MSAAVNFETRVCRLPPGTAASVVAAQLPAIDASGNYLDDNRLLAEFSSGSAAEVAARARGCGVVWTIVSPLDGLLPQDHSGHACRGAVDRAIF